MARIDPQTMLRGMLGILLGLTAGPIARAADTPAKPLAVSGLVIDEQRKGQKEVTSITVKEDGQQTPIKYVVDGGMDKRSTDALPGIFTVGRVKLTYKLDGEVRHLTSVEKIVGRQSGVVVGEVIETHGWWVEVKPKDGPPEGYAANFPKEKWAATEAQIKTLEKGDTVSIKFTTDGERHRIATMEKKGK